MNPLLIVKMSDSLLGSTSETPQGYQEAGQANKATYSIRSFIIMFLTMKEFLVHFNVIVLGNPSAAGRSESSSES
jgi:hypothetical protein